MPSSRILATRCEGCQFTGASVPRLCQVASFSRRAICRHRSKRPWSALSRSSKIEETPKEVPAQVSFDTPREEIAVALERAFLVSVALPERPWVGDDPLEELRGLAATAGAIVVGGLCQKRQKINPGSYIGKGKLAELQEQVQAQDADVIIFDNDLSPAQIRNL